MRVISATTPVVVNCPRCWRRVVLNHASVPQWMDLQAALSGHIIDRSDPIGLPVALALHVRDCSGPVVCDGEAS